ncbi:MAG: InlB B-repeat-containing protein, partial [Spirochaetaceae bacterium]|nr:InlB B-repeat-containing protein [Spirochaetaceae bacterium]
MPVTFNPYYGTVTPSVRMVTPGSTVPTASVPAPSRTGYTFVKWYDADTGGSEVNWDTPITTAKTVYARWTANSYTVTY